MNVNFLHSNTYTFSIQSNKQKILLNIRIRNKKKTKFVASIIHMDLIKKNEQGISVNVFRRVVTKPFFLRENDSFRENRHRNRRVKKMTFINGNDPAIQLIYDLLFDLTDFNSIKFFQNAKSTQKINKYICSLTNTQTL